MIAAALSLQDPRERPAEFQAQADQQHARFKAEDSDFLTWLNLWRYLKEQQKELSSSAFRRMCKREYLNYLRVREWQDFESQLRQVCKEMKIERRPPRGHPRRGRHPPGAALRAALATSASWRSARRSTAGGPPPDAGVPRRPRREVRDLPGQRAGAEEPAVPDGRRARRDQPALGPPERRDQAGVGRAARRRPGEAHLLRAALEQEARGRDGLRAGDAVRRPAGRRPARVVRQGRRRRWPASCSSGTRSSTASGRRRHKFLETNRRLLEEAEELEHRARRRDIVVDEHTLFDFYDARIGRGRQRRALRPVVEAGAAAARPTCSPSTRRCSPTTPPTRSARPTTPSSGRARG